MGLPDFGISEGGSIVGNLLKNYVFTPKADASGMGSWPQYQAPQTSQAPYNYNKGTNGAPYTPAPVSLGSTSAAKTSSGRSSAQAKADAAAEKARKSLSNSFSNTIDAYKNQINDLPGQQQESLNQIGALAGTQTQSIQDALDAALGKFTGYRNDVATNQKATLQDLADNTRNLFQAGNNYLGARGAGDSSATGMYSAALTQEANKQRTGIQNQTTKQYNDLNVAQSDVQAQAQQSLDQVQTWKATQTTTLINQYNDLKRQLQSAYANAKDSEKQAIANLDTQLYNNAVTQLSNIQNVAAQYASQFGGALDTQSGQDNTSGIGQGATDAAGNVVQQNFSTTGMQIDPSQISGGSQNQDGSYTGYYNGQKVDSKDGTNWYLAQ